MKCDLCKRKEQEIGNVCTSCYLSESKKGADSILKWEMTLGMSDEGLRT